MVGKSEKMDTKLGNCPWGGRFEVSPSSVLDVALTKWRWNEDPRGMYGNLRGISTTGLRICRGVSHPPLEAGPAILEVERRIFGHESSGFFDEKSELLFSAILTTRDGEEVIAAEPPPGIAVPQQLQAPRLDV